MNINGVPYDSIIIETWAQVLALQRLLSELKENNPNLKMPSQAELNQYIVDARKEIKKQYPQLP